MDDQTLITDQIVARVHAQCQGEGVRHQGGLVFDHEPVFQEAVQQQLIGIAGKLVLSGSPAKLARDVADDVDRLVISSAAVMREAHRDLLADLMPAEPIRRSGPRGKRRRPRGAKRTRRLPETDPPQDEGNGDETSND